jgi:hypothetical protein
LAGKDSRQEAEARGLFMVVEAGMEARDWILEAGKDDLSI